ncbi:MAG TPA: hypothetical protein VL916_08045, partial [Ilumatobacteraceae bacterium]|nr:hypothetical protein [Ilumatobacteraceae bacterium]
MTMFAVAILAGCTSPRLVDCRDGTSCPMGYICTTTGCASPEEQAACLGRIEGDACTVQGLDGACRDGGCLLVACGNSYVDVG